MGTRRILIVEPDPLLQMVLIDILIQEGATVCAAVSDEELQTILTGFEPDLAVVSGDNRGTFASGWHTAALISHIAPTLPLVMLTTNRTVFEEWGQTPRGKLFVAGLLKPFNINELLSTIASCCGVFTVLRYEMLLSHAEQSARCLST